MPLKYTISPKKQLVTIVATGLVTRDDFDRTRARLFDDERIKDAAAVLVDADKAESGLTFTDLQEIATRLSGFFDYGIGRVAIVASSDFVYSLAKTFGVFAESQPVRVRPFRNVSDAEEWLLSPRGGSPNA